MSLIYFPWVRVTRSLVLCVTFCLFVPFLLAIVLSVLYRFTDPDYPFGIFKLFLELITIPERMSISGVCIAQSSDSA